MYDESFKMDRKCTEIKSKMLQILLVQSCGIQSIEKPDETLICFNQAIEFDPTNPAYYQKKGKFLESLQRFKRSD